MRSLIIYDSKKGTTEDCAKTLAQALKGDILSLKNNVKIDWDNYDLIIMGTPIYMGQPMKTLKKFCNTNSDLLKTKNIAFFICGGGNATEMTESFKKTMPTELINKAKIISHFGGELRVDRAHFLLKVMMKKMLEDKNITHEINHGEINKFIKVVSEVK